MRTPYSLVKSNQASKKLCRKKRVSSLILLVLAISALHSRAETTAQNANSTPGGNSSAASATASATQNYELGKVIRFGMGGGSEPFRQGGWSATEANATWTTGTSAKLAFLVKPSSDPLNLRISLAALSGMTNPATPTPQPVEVVANGQKIADWEVTTRSDFNAVIPASIVKNGGALVIELKTPKAVSPKAMGISEDARVLGVYCFELAITKGE